MSRVLGIDPGKSGALAVLDGYGELVEIDDMPVVGKAVSPQLLADLIDDYRIGASEPGEYLTAIVEKVGAMPKQGVASSFNFGQSYGVVLGVLAGCSVRTEHVAPSVWKKEMRLSADKNLARQRAAERWPSWSAHFKRVKDDGRAEAALLALWWIEQGKT